MVPAKAVWWTLAGLGALVILGAGVSQLPSSLAPPGPLAGTVANNVTQTTYGGHVQQPFTFGGFVFVNQTPGPYTVEAVEPANVPLSLSVHTAVYRVVHRQAIGAALGWVRAFRPPMVIHRGETWEPLVEVKALTSGVYTIQGVIIYYRQHGVAYAVYVPDQFVFCAGPHAHAECSGNLPLPPRRWTLWQNLRAHMLRLP
jgi:hypothetical protein